MLTVGCCGFAVPATRYFKEFAFVEIQETHFAVPGIGTVGRWKREAPPGFRFAMLAPREIEQESFRSGPVTEQAITTLLDLGKEISATVAVFLSAPEMTHSRANKAAVKEFMGAVRSRFELIVWEPPLTWDADEADAIMAGLGIAARDPLKQGLSKAPVAYYRMPGPAGYKSRYEDPAIDKLADLASKATHKEATYVFANVDMFADAKRFRKALGK
jgi:uncharacterized protein YecE (DUF72 family)